MRIELKLIVVVAVYYVVPKRLKVLIVLSSLDHLDLDDSSGAQFTKRYFKFYFKIIVTFLQVVFVQCNFF